MTMTLSLQSGRWGVLREFNIDRVSKLPGLCMLGKRSSLLVINVLLAGAQRFYGTMWGGSAERSLATSLVPSRTRALSSAGYAAAAGWGVTGRYAA